MTRAGRIDGSLEVKRREFLETASAVVVGGLTAYEGRRESAPDPAYDLVATDFQNLAGQLGL